MTRNWIAALAAAITLSVSVPALAGQTAYHRRDLSRNSARLRQYREEVRRDRALIARLDRQVHRDLARHDERRLRRDRARRLAAQAELKRDLDRVEHYQRAVYADQRGVPSHRRMYRRPR